MSNFKKLNLFYQEPDPDRWFMFDRFPRRIFRSLFRREKIGGMKKWFINLTKGLNILQHNYAVNPFSQLTDSKEIAFVIGKPQVIDQIPDHTKIVYGPAVASHPSDSTFWQNKRIIHLIFSCQWLKELYERDLPVSIPSSVWPSGIETDIWKPSTNTGKKNRILLYDKVRWDYDLFQEKLILPIRKKIEEKEIEIIDFKYGKYEEEDFKNSLSNVDAMIFLCEHETQGFAYLQALSCNIPIFAWDRGGYWQDPDYYPHKVIFGPVTSVPYWDTRCGLKFSNIAEFDQHFEVFLATCYNNKFSPRNYIMDNLTLEICAKKYIEICEKVYNVNA